MNYKLIVTVIFIVLLIGIQVSLNRILAEIKRIRQIKEYNNFKEQENVK